MHRSYLRYSALPVSTVPPQGHHILSPSQLPGPCRIPLHILSLQQNKELRFFCRALMQGKTLPLTVKREQKNGRRKARFRMGRTRLILHVLWTFALPRVFQLFLPKTHKPSQAKGRSRSQAKATPARAGGPDVDTSPQRGRGSAHARRCPRGRCPGAGTPSRCVLATHAYVQHDTQTGGRAGRSRTRTR